MPELPEVEYTARQLRATVVCATIREGIVFWERAIGHPSTEAFLKAVGGRRITNVRRRGKFLILDLDDKLFLSIHRRMTGNFLLLEPGWQVDTSLREVNPIAWSTKGPSFTGMTRVDYKEGYNTSAGVIAPVRMRAVEPPETLYCRVCFLLEDGRCLLFTDPRKFGRVELWFREQEMEAFTGLGLEPLDEDFTVERLQEAIGQRKTGIKQVLLSQDIVVGVGNIYADETLFYARLHPLRPANSLAPEEVALLHEGIVAVLKKGIEHGGTSFNDYRDLWGEAGDNYNHVRVYKKDGTPCVHCGTTIERIVIAQRSTHFCPNCQRMSADKC